MMPFSLNEYVWGISIPREQQLALDALPDWQPDDVHPTTVHGSATRVQDARNGNHPFAACAAEGRDRASLGSVGAPLAQLTRGPPDASAEPLQELRAALPSGSGSQQGGSQPAPQAEPSRGAAALSGSQQGGSQPAPQAESSRGAAALSGSGSQQGGSQPAPQAEPSRGAAELNGSQQGGGPPAPQAELSPPQAQTTPASLPAGHYPLTQLPTGQPSPVKRLASQLCVPAAAPQQPAAAPQQPAAAPQQRPRAAESASHHTGGSVLSRIGAGMRHLALAVVPTRSLFPARADAAAAAPGVQPRTPAGSGAAHASGTPTSATQLPISSPMHTPAPFREGAGAECEDPLRLAAAPAAHTPRATGSAAGHTQRAASPLSPPAALAAAAALPLPNAVARASRAVEEMGQVAAASRARNAAPSAGPSSQARQPGDMHDRPRTAVLAPAAAASPVSSAAEFLAAAAVPQPSPSRRTHASIASQLPQLPQATLCAAAPTLSSPGPRVLPRSLLNPCPLLQSPSPPRAAAQLPRTADAGGAVQFPHAAESGGAQRGGVDHGAATADGGQTLAAGEARRGVPDDSAVRRGIKRPAAALDSDRGEGLARSGGSAASKEEGREERTARQRHRLDGSVPAVQEGRQPSGVPQPDGAAAGGGVMSFVGAGRPAAGDLGLAASQPGLFTQVEVGHAVSSPDVQAQDLPSCRAADAEGLSVDDRFNNEEAGPGAGSIAALQLRMQALPMTQAMPDSPIEDFVDGGGIGEEEWATWEVQEAAGGIDTASGGPKGGEGRAGGKYAAGACAVMETEVVDVMGMETEVVEAVVAATEVVDVVVSETEVVEAAATETEVVDVAATETEVVNTAVMDPRVAAVVQVAGVAGGAGAASRGGQEADMGADEDVGEAGIASAGPGGAQCAGGGWADAVAVGWDEEQDGTTPGSGERCGASLQAAAGASTTPSAPEASGADVPGTAPAWLLPWLEQAEGEAPVPQLAGGGAECGSPSEMEEILWNKAVAASRASSWRLPTIDEVLAKYL